MQTINENSVVKKTVSLLSTKVNDDTVMMDTDKGTYFGMNAIATFIWENLDSPIQVSDLCHRLQTISDVAEDECAAQTIAFLQQLSENKLIEIIE